MSKDIIKFKLYPVKGDPRYYNTYILEDRRSMIKFSETITGEKSKCGFQAITHSFYPSQDQTSSSKQLPLTGAILFYKNGFSNGIVAHELSHAVNYFFLKNSIRFDLGGEYSKDWHNLNEAYAWSLGYMVHEFWKNYYKHFKTINKNERY